MVASQASCKIFLSKHNWFQRYLPQKKEVKFTHNEALFADIISLSSRYATCCNPYTTAGASTVDIVQKIIFIDESGEEIGEVRSFPQRKVSFWNPSTWFEKFYCYGYEWTFQIETVGDALLRIGPVHSGRVKHVVTIMPSELNSDPIAISVFEMNESIVLSDRNGRGESERQE